MATLNINGSKGSGNQSFKQIEGDTWSSIYLPAIDKDQRSISASCNQSRTKHDRDCRS